MLGFLPRLRPARAAAARSTLAPPPLAPAAVEAAPAPALPLSFDAITCAEQFTAISVAASDIVPNGRVAKFLVDLRDSAAPRVRFVNGNFTEDGETPDSARYHYSFAQAVLNIPESLDEFNDQTYFTESKRYIAGVVHTYLLDGAAEPIYGLQFYPQDVIREAGVLAAVRVIKARITVPGARFAFVATGSQQTTATIAGELAGEGVDDLSVDRILGAIRYIPLNLGEAWGVLRIFPRDNDALRPTDIPVFDDLPLDLSVVAGVLTRAVQDSNSHVNLKSKERATPNAVLRNAGPDHPRLAAFADLPVHLVVRGADFLIEETTEAIIAEKMAARMNRPIVRLDWDPETALRSYDELAQGTAAQTLAHSRRYGSKATNLGFLAHREVLGRVGDPGSPSARAGYDLTPRGFAVPLQMYREFVDHPRNHNLRRALDALIDAEEAGTLSPKERAALVEDVQRRFLAGHFPRRALKRLRAALAAVLPDALKIKVRSSANAEDVPDFDGAGLHDSFAADPDKTDDADCECRIETEDDGDNGEVKRKVKPKSLVCAVKGVYASLWNKRAVEERSFARIDHRSVAMGLAIVPAYDGESEVAANAVVITRVLGTRDVYGYSLSVQEGNNLVTNPNPGTWSEVTIAAFVSDDEPMSLTVTRFARPVKDRPPRGTPVLPAATMRAMVDLARTIERAYCRAKPRYYAGDCRFVTIDNEKSTSLDLELKILADGRFVVKQVREFGGR